MGIFNSSSAATRAGARLSGALPIIVSWALSASAALTVSLGEWNGWNSAYSIDNDLVSMKIVPKTGGKLFEFSLEGHDMFFLNESLLGDTTAYADSLLWFSVGNHPVGGTRFWPMPQSAWSKPWPPPSAIDYGFYQHELTSESADTVVISVTSEKEWARDVNLQMMREYMAFAHGAHLQITHALASHNIQKVTRGIRQVCQMLPFKDGTLKGDAFAVYFPKSMESEDGYTKLGMSGVPSSLTLTDGIVSMNGAPPENGHIKIGALAKEGWVAWVDNEAEKAYILTSPYIEGEEYPDNNSNIIIWKGKIEDDQVIVEVEMQSHLKELATEDTIQWVTHNYRTSIGGPIVAVNKAGAVKTPLAIDEGGTVNGEFGVFYEGTLALHFSGAETAAKTWEVSPLAKVSLDETVAVPAGATQTALILTDKGGKLIDTLSSAAISEVSVRTTTRAAPVARTITFAKDALVIADARNIRSVSLFTLDGKTVAKAAGTGKASLRVPTGRLTGSAYMYSIESASGTRTGVVKYPGAGRVVIEK